MQDDVNTYCNRTAGDAPISALQTMVEPQTWRMPASVPSPEGFGESLLRSFPTLGEPEIVLLRERGLLQEETFLSADALALAQLVGAPMPAIAEFQKELRREREQRVRLDVARRVAELTAINRQLSEEVDGIMAANRTLLLQNTHLKNRQTALETEEERKMGDYKVLQSRQNGMCVESNRLSAEIDFLQQEHRKLASQVAEKHVLLDDLWKRFTAVRSSFEFISGETDFARDIMTNVEGLLHKAMLQKKTLNEKIAATEESMEKLFSEFNQIVQKGKMEFYRVR